MEFGDHCALRSCRQLDFLPFVCEACSQIFCKEHSKPEQHGCLKSTSQQPLKEQASGGSMPLFSCELPGCVRTELFAIDCVGCHKNFCISHRHPDDHDCKEKSVSSVKKRNMQVTASAISTPQGSKGVGRRSEKCSQMVTMMRLKQKAQGPSSLAQSHRVYYNVTLPSGDIKPLFFSKDWSVGKVIDHVAAMFHIKNTNHQSTSEAKLVLSSNDDNVLDVKLSLSSQQTNGSTITLSYIQFD